MRNGDGDDDVLDQHARVDFMVLCLWTTVRMWDVGQSDTLSWLWSSPSCGMLFWLRSNPSSGMLFWLSSNPSCGMLFCFYSCELQYSMVVFFFFIVFF